MNFEIYFLATATPTELFTPPYPKWGTNYFIISLPKIDDPSRNGKIYDRSVHSSFPVGSRIAIRCGSSECPKIAYL